MQQKPEGGTVVCTQEPAQSQIGEATPTSDSGPDVILVVDDDPEIRDLVRWLLEDEGWTVETAADGRAALDQATRSKPALIVLDMGLPIMHGEEVARRIHAVYDDPPPIVVVSADGHAGERAARIGAASFLHKPFNVDDLTRIVRSTLGQV
jgi:DNA-binding response OmpR family regulator